MLLRFDSKLDSSIAFCEDKSDGICIICLLIIWCSNEITWCYWVVWGSNNMVVVVFSWCGWDITSWRKYWLSIESIPFNDVDLWNATDATMIKVSFFRNQICACLLEVGYCEGGDMAANITKIKRFQDVRVGFFLEFWVVEWVLIGGVVYKRSLGNTKVLINMNKGRFEFEWILFHAYSLNLKYEYSGFKNWNWTYGCIN